MEAFMTIRCVVPLVGSLLVICSAGAQNLHPAQSPSAVPQTAEIQLPPTYVPPGKQMFKQYCASCHGTDGKGSGPVAPSFRKPPPSLTTLAKKHGGHFPEEYVANVLRFGAGFSAHGSSEMPVWGPIFQYLDNYNEAAVRERIKNLCDFLESIQEK
jgi:mono/diheme cytochrome c family protein